MSDERYCNHFWKEVEREVTLIDKKEEILRERVKTFYCPTCKKFAPVEWPE